MVPSYCCICVLILLLYVCVLILVQAPDLGKEVATFNTGKIDENFFSSDDEMASEVQVYIGAESGGRYHTTISMSSYYYI